MKTAVGLAVAGLAASSVFGEAAFVEWSFDDVKTPLASRGQARGGAPSARAYGGHLRRAASPRARNIAGWFGWNPSAWDDDLAARALTQRYYGSGVHEPLMWYAKLVAPMVGAFMAYKTGWTSEAKAPETKRLAPMLKHEIMGYFRNLAKAERAADLVEAAIANQKTAFDRPESAWGTRQEQKKLVSDMRASLAEMRVKLQSLAEKHDMKGVAK